jgi:hypothetical protein
VTWPHRADEKALHKEAIKAIEEERRQLWMQRWRYAEHVLIVDILLAFEAELAAWRNDKVRQHAMPCGCRKWA